MRPITILVRTFVIVVIITVIITLMALLGKEALGGGDDKSASL